MNLALRRNLFYPTAEIYSNTPAGFFDYGPMGVKIRNNIVDFWRKELVEANNGLEIDGCQILPKAVFEASGHVANFADSVVKCKKCGIFYRGDKLLSDSGIEVEENISPEAIDKLIQEKNVLCAKCKSKQFEPSFKFNIMFGVNVGIDNKQPAYLRGEACQTIYLDFLRVYKNSRQNLPLVIAQIGKAFRNEIAPKNALIRTREFTQMDIQVFFNPNKPELFKYNANTKLPIIMPEDKEAHFETLKDLVAKKIIKSSVEAEYLEKYYNFLIKLGYKDTELRFKYTSDDERPFYAQAAWDCEAHIEEMGWIEITGIHSRTDHDLSVHQKHSQTSLQIVEDAEKFLPHIFEVSIGTDRILYTLLSNRLEGMNEKMVLKLNEPIMPYHLGLFPLVNKDGLDTIGETLRDKLKKKFKVIYDDKGSIGKRYARIDEIGVRYAVTIDYDTKDKDIVTVRDSWTTQQVKVNVKDLEKFFDEKLFA
jgi:glycyl-tRNA synthetase